MNTKTKIKKISFTLDNKDTTCEIEFESEDPVLTGGYFRKKVFSNEKSVIDIIKDDVPDYLLWE